MVLAPKWKGVAVMALAATFVSCSSDDPGILGVGDELGRTTLIVEVSPSSVLIPVVGGQGQLQASVRSSGGQTASGLSVTWTSLNPGVVSVSGSGALTALAEGTARIEAKVLNLADTAVVTVTRLPAGLSIETDDLLFADLGATATLDASVWDANGEPLDSTVAWSSSNNSVATVSASGTVTAVGEGFATITGVARTARDELQVEVDTGVAALDLSVEALELDALEATTWFSVAGVDVLGEPVDVELEYSIEDEGIAEISGDTVLIARSAGTTELTVRVSGTSLVETIPVVVDQEPVSVNLYMDRGVDAPAEPDSDTVTAFTSFEARVEAFDANGFVFTPESGVVWSNTDGDVLTLDVLDGASAFLQFTDPGTTTVVAEVGGAADSLVYTVVEPDSLAMTLDADTLRIFPGESREVTPTFSTPDSADLCCGQAVWTSSDASVVTVSEAASDTLLVESSVSLMAEGPGSAWVTAQRGPVTDSVFVHVSAQGFNITVVEGGSGDAMAELELASDAARRWEEVLIGDLPSVAVSLEAGQCQRGIAEIDAMVDDLLLIVAPTTGQATVTPCVVRADGGLPAVAVVHLDAGALEATGAADALVRHLVGHALGFGITGPWESGLAGQDTVTADPHFAGAQAVAEFEALAGDTVGNDVAVEDTGAPAHWREGVLGVELMTGAYVEGTAHDIPLSRVTVGAFTDMGYEGAPWRADDFSLTLPPELAGLDPVAVDEKLWGPSWTVTDDGTLGWLAAPPPSP